MPHHIAKQVHDKFKIFSGELAADGSIGKLADEVAAFANKPILLETRFYANYCPQFRVVLGKAGVVV